MPRFTIPAVSGDQAVNVVFYKPITAKAMSFTTKQDTPIQIDLHNGIVGGNPMNQVTFTIVAGPQNGTLE